MNPLKNVVDQFIGALGENPDTNKDSEKADNQELKDLENQIQDSVDSINDNRNGPTEDIDISLGDETTSLPSAENETQERQSNSRLRQLTNEELPPSIRNQVSGDGVAFVTSGGYIVWTNVNNNGGEDHEKGFGMRDDVVIFGRNGGFDESVMDGLFTEGGVAGPGGQGDNGGIDDPGVIDGPGGVGGNGGGMNGDPLFGDAPTMSINPITGEVIGDPNNPGAGDGNGDGNGNGDGTENGNGNGDGGNGDWVNGPLPDDYKVITHVWGDPHVTENAIRNKHTNKDDMDWHFGDNSIMVLPDGTKIGMNTDKGLNGTHHDEFFVKGVFIQDGERLAQTGLDYDDSTRMNTEVTENGHEFANQIHAKGEGSGTFMWSDDANNGQGGWLINGNDGQIKDIANEKWKTYQKGGKKDFNGQYENQHQNFELTKFQQDTLNGVHREAPPIVSEEPEIAAQVPVDPEPIATEPAIEEPVEEPITEEAEVQEAIAEEEAEVQDQEPVAEETTAEDTDSGLQDIGDIIDGAREDGDTLMDHLVDQAEHSTRPMEVAEEIPEEETTQPTRPMEVADNTSTNSDPSDLPTLPQVSADDVEATEAIDPSELPTLPAVTEDDVESRIGSVGGTAIQGETVVEENSESQEDLQNLSQLALLSLAETSEADAQLGSLEGEILSANRNISDSQIEFEAINSRISSGDFENEQERATLSSDSADLSSEIQAFKEELDTLQSRETLLRLQA